MRADELSFTRNNAVNYGGGLDAVGQTQTNVTRSTWQQNTAGSGAGVSSFNDLPSPAILNIHESSLNNNSAHYTGGACYFGGFIKATISSTTFDGNQADFGGGAYLDVNATIYISNSNFTANQAFTSGGGTYLNTSAAITSAGCVLDRNNASYGGGLFCNGCAVRADRLSFTRNDAVNIGGGLLAVNQAQVHATRSTWLHNTAGNGAGVTSFNGLPSPATLTIHESSLNNNIATDYGGACNLRGFIKVNLHNNTWISNSAFHGGAIYFEGPSTNDSNTGVPAEKTVLGKPALGSSTPDNMTGATAAATQTSIMNVNSNNFTNNSAQSRGGAVYLPQLTNSLVSAVFVNCHMLHNKADTGGALACEHGTRATLKGSRLAANSAKSFAGAVYCASCEFDTLQATLDANTCEGDGGGLNSQGTARIKMKNSSFTGNVATGFGGAMSMVGGSQVSASDGCMFAGNSATHGGVVWAGEAANLTLSNSSVLNNSAVTSGGGLSVKDTAVVLVTVSSIIAANNATYGGGIYADGSSLITCNGSTRLHGNSCHDGGGVYASGSAQVIMEGAIVSNNEATSNGGGFYFITRAVGNLTGCTVVFNSALNDGGGYYAVDNSVLSLNNSLIANNSAKRGGGILNSDASQLVLLGDTSLTGNHADDGYGGGVSLLSGSFNIQQVTRAARSNTGRFSADIQSALTNLTIVGNSTVHGFANRIGKDEGLLHVVLNTSGYYGLPCQHIQAQAILDDGTFLGSNVSDERGLVLLGFRVVRPPGRYIVSLSSPDYQNVHVANLTLHIRSCILGEVTPSPDACQPCQQGFYSFDSREAVCSPCPANANCSGADVVAPIPGYWRSSADSIQIHRCPNPSACEATNDAALLECAADRTCGTSITYKDLQCAPGYHGNMCGLCLPHTGAARPFVCRECMKPGYLIALYILAAVVLLCLIMLMCHLNRIQDRVVSDTGNRTCRVPAAQLLKPLLLYSQYMLIVSSMSIDWPVSIAYPLRVLAWVWSPASPETLSMDCLLPRNTHLPISIQKVLFYVCSPLVILGLLLLIEMGKVYITRARNILVAVQVKDLLHSSALVAVFFFYPSVLRSFLSMFACIPIDQPAPAPYTPAAIGSYWVLDLNQVCFIGYHKAWSLAFGLPCTLLVCLGLPTGILLLLLARRAHLAEEATRMHYGFLYVSYRQPMFYWECVVMAQTMVLVAISVFGVNLGVFYQVSVMDGALMLMVILLLIFKPYAYQQAGKVMLQAVFCLLLTSHTGLTFLHFGSVEPSPVYGIVMGSVVLLVNMAFVVSVVWQLFRLINWQQVGSTIQHVCSKVVCGKSCIDRLVGLGVCLGGKKQASLLPQQRGSQIAASSV